MKAYLGGAYGGFTNQTTFALLVEGANEENILIDAGSGTTKLPLRQRHLDGAFLTHTHLDHLLGLPALASAPPFPFYFPRGDLAQVLSRVFAPPVWPVGILPEIMTPASPVHIGDLNVSWHSVSHPDECVSYRIEEDFTGHSIVVATDVEWKKMSPEQQRDWAAFARDTDLLLFDAQYLPEEYVEREGWGHSTWEDAVAAARLASARQLWLIHHDPARIPLELHDIDTLAHQAFPAARCAFSGDVWQP